MKRVKMMGWVARRTAAFSTAAYPIRRSVTVALTLAPVVAVALVFAAVLAQAPDASAQETYATDSPATTDATDAAATTGPSFALRCNFSHRNMDDPIVHPGEKGAAHSHDFFGNRSTNFKSTYDSLLKAKTTCRHPADKSAYWIPTVKWNGKNLKPRYALFDYRPGPKDPTTVKPFPAGLKMVPNTRVAWKCDGDTYAQNPPTQCANGRLSVRIIAPDCSNGELDSTDHRSHMAYTVRQDNGTRLCPEDHPIPVPALNLIIKFSIPTTPGEVTLSSGDASTMHTDFFNAWDQKTLEGLVRQCINEVGPSDPRPPECRRT